jgi:hypothetical protein
MGVYAHGPKELRRKTPNELEVVLYGRTDRQTRGSAGAAVKDKILREKLRAASRAWDFLSLALSLTAADLAGHHASRQLYDGARNSRAARLSCDKV